MLNSIFTGSVTVLQILIMLGAAAVLGVLNSLVFSYRTMQSRSLAVMLALLPMVSAVIIFAVNGNLGIGVAVAGAFTLVRFRSVAGNGREMLAIFDSMAIGMLLGMGYVLFAALVFAAVAFMFLLVTTLRLGELHTARTLRVRVPEDLEYDGMFDDLLEEYTSHREIEKVRTVNMGTEYEISWLVRLREPEKTKEFLDAIRVRNGNRNVCLMSGSDHDTI